MRFVSIYPENGEKMIVRNCDVLRIVGDEDLRKIHIELKNPLYGNKMVIDEVYANRESGAARMHALCRNLNERAEY